MTGHGKRVLINAARALIQDLTRILDRLEADKEVDELKQEIHELELALRERQGGDR